MGLLGIGVGRVITFVTQGDLYDLLKRQEDLNQQLALQKTGNNGTWPNNPSVQNPLKVSR